MAGKAGYSKVAGSVGRRPNDAQDIEVLFTNCNLDSEPVDISVRIKIKITETTLTDGRSLKSIRF